MRILVTGHKGFIGTQLCEFLKDFEIIGRDIKENQEDDILTCELPDVDIVIHLAGIGGVRESMEDPKKYWYNNVEGTKRILDRYKNIRVLVAGSSSQYEPHLNPYAASKSIIESIPHPNVCFMRFHTVYGDVPRANMFFDKLLNNKLEYVTSHERDFIHIEDLCIAIGLIMNSRVRGPIDVGTGITTKISNIRPDLPVRLNTPGERQITHANTLELNKLGFYPKHTVKEFLTNKGFDTIINTNGDK